MVFTDTHRDFKTRAVFRVRQHIQTKIKMAALATSALLVMSCSAYTDSVEASCEVRDYHQQTLLAFFDNSPRAAALPGVDNSIHFPQYITDDLWLIQDYVKVKQWPRISEPKTTDYEKISSDTTFLIVGVDDPSTFEFDSEQYFDDGYSDLGLDESCPILTGQRNGKFALATLRRSGGKETRDEQNRCNIYATLAFFGILKEDLDNYADYVKVDMLGTQYDRYAIRSYLASKKSCGGDTFENLRLAAENGNPEAQYTLSGLYTGIGGVLAKNEMQSLKWLRLAAQQGYADAQSDLGDVYRFGLGVDEDEIAAVKWYRLAAKQGNKSAQFNLGQMYAEGKGVEKDYVQSYVWISISETDEIMRLANQKKSLGRLMTEEQIAQAESLAAKCIESNFQDCE